MMNSLSIALCIYFLLINLIVFSSYQYYLYCNSGCLLSVYCCLL